MNHQCAKYESSNYKDLLDRIDIGRSFYAENKRDQNCYAYLTWRMHDDNIDFAYKEMGEGYFVSSIILLENCLEDNRDRKGDSIVFPILFNIEQAVELYLKAMIKLVQRNGENLCINTNGHNIASKLQSFMDRFHSKDPAKAAIAFENYDIVSAFLSYLFEYTDDCTFARFPDSKNATPHFFVNQSKQVIVDMSELLSWAKASFYILDRNYINLASLYEQKE